MVKKTVLISVLIFMAAAACIINNQASRRVIKSQPDWYFLSLHSYKNFPQLFSVGFGFRSLSADMDYIQFLQYYGDAENSGTRYRDLYKYIDTMTDTDPGFTFAYTYGAAILAFNLHRYDEAINLIKKGLKYNPGFWKLRFYLGAIIYRQKGDTIKYTGLLEEAVKFDDHPAIIERMLGNIYEISKTPDQAVMYWVNLYKKTKDIQSRHLALLRIQAIIKQGKINDLKAVLKATQ